MNTWPKNEQFRRFAALVADGVQFALANGWTISPHRRNGCLRCCPLGAAMLIRGYSQTFALGGGIPGRESAARALGIPKYRVQDFTIGFDGLLSDDRVVTRAYFLLGQAYRERYRKRSIFDTLR